MGKYPIIFDLEWVLVIVAHIGSADSSVLFSPRGCGFNLHDNHFGAEITQPNFSFCSDELRKEVRQLKKELQAIKQRKEEGSKPAEDTVEEGTCTDFFCWNRWMCVVFWAASSVASQQCLKKIMINMETLVRKKRWCVCVWHCSFFFYPPEVLHFSIKAHRESRDSGCRCCTSVLLCLFAVCL